MQPYEINGFGGGDPYEERTPYEEHTPYEERAFRAERHAGEEAYEEGGSYGEEEEEFGAEGRRVRQEEVPESLESPFSEEEEAELATELMGVVSEEELEQFLGNWLRAAADKAGGVLRSSVGRQLGGMLKNVARKALPTLGGALGNVIAPGVGGQIGSKIGSWASNLFELEAAGADPEEYEFEAARRFVRLSGAAAANAAHGSRRAAPQVLARQAVHSAARRYAPGVARRFPVFARPAPWYWPAPVPVGADASMSRSGGDIEGGSARAGTGSPEEEGERVWGRAEAGSAPGGTGGVRAPGHAGGRATSGRWVRHGRKIVILGV
ncbi:hypothetical protein [Streptomyces sp. NPDC059009]|uniref:hypothetical protein n=1 Tax=Streptomyces sp. NPDC059009 TaxID=3346694 RepID=UPI0036760CF9